MRSRFQEHAAILILGIAFAACDAKTVQPSSDEMPAAATPQTQTPSLPDTVDLAAQSRLMDFQTLEDMVELFQSVSANETEMAKLINAYFAVNLLPRTVTSDSYASSAPNDIFRAGWAECGTRDYMLNTVLKEFGIKTRRIGFQQVPYQVGHVGTEFFVDGQWKFFDTTFGVFFTRPGVNDPLSISEARRLYPDIDVHIPNLPIYADTARVIGDLGYKVEETNIIATHVRNYPAAEVERTYFISAIYGGETLAYDDNITVINMTGKDAFTIGESDDALVDMVQPVSISDGNTHRPTLPERFGMFDSGNIRQVYHFITDEPKAVDVMIDILDKPNMDRVFVDLDHYATKSEDIFPFARTPDESTIRLKMEIRPPLSTLYISAPWDDKAYYIDAISVNVTNPEDLPRATP